MQKRVSMRKRDERNKRNCLALFETTQKNGQGWQYIVFDTETTGLKDAYIVQLSAQKYKVQDHSPVLLEKKCWYLRPPFWMEQEVVNIHHITNEFLVDKPQEEEAIGEISAWFGPHPLVVGQNITFDIGMMDAMYQRCEIGHFTPAWSFDTLDMMRDLISPEEMKKFLKKEYDGDKKTLDTHLSHLYQLQNAVIMYGLDQGLTFHNANDDVEATARLLYVFYQEYKKTKDPGTVIPYISGANFYEGHNLYQKGVYVFTDRGPIYFSTYYKDWRSTSVNLDEIDLDGIESLLENRYGLTMADISKMTANKWKTRKKAWNGS